MRARRKAFVRRHGPVPFVLSAAGDAMADGSRKEVFDLQTSSCDRPSESQEHRSCYDESDLGTKYGERSSASLVGPPPASLGTLLQLTRVLTLDDLGQVLNRLYYVRTKWLNIGLELGVHIRDLNNIEREANDDSTRLRKMLSLALNSQQKVTWKQICEALCNPVIGESVYAKRLEEELQRSTDTHCQLTRKLDSRESVITHTEQILPRKMTDSGVHIHDEYNACPGTGSAAHPLRHASSSASSLTSPRTPTSPYSQDHLQNTVASGREIKATLGQCTATTASKEASVSLPDVITSGQSSKNPLIKKLQNHFCDKPCEMSFKINIVGDSGVGKTTMLLRLMKPEFMFGDPMVGTTLSQEAVGVCVFQYKDERVKFYIWDTAGFERNFDIIPNSFFRDVDGTIIMFDVSDEQTLVNALSDKGSKRGKGKCWLKEVDFKAEDNCYPVKILVGGKIDVDPVKERKVTYEEAQKRAQEYDLPYLEVSSKESLGIHEVFYKMVELLVNKYKYSGDNATDSPPLPCVRRRTRRRDSIQCAADVRSPASADSATDSTRLPACDTHSQAEQRTEQSRSCYCA